MKQFKRVMATLLCLVMTLGLFAGLTLPASAADTTETLTASDFAATGTSYAASSGVSKGGTARYAAYTAKNSSNIQFNKKQNCYIVSTTSGGKVKSVKVNISSGSQAIIVKGSNTAYTTSNAYSNGTEIARGTSTFTATPTTDYEYFAIVGNANGAVYISSVEVTWTSGDSKTLDSITLGGSYTTTFPQGGTFNHTGMTVTANYSDSTTADVTSNASWSSPNMSTTGSQTVTVSYTEGGVTKTATYTITVQATPTHTLSSSVSPSGGGSVSLSASTVAEGATATATATPAAGYDFTSWSISGTGASLSSTTANPTTVTMGTANATVTANFTAKTPAGALTLSEAGTPTSVSVSGKYVGDTVTLPSDATNYPADTDYNTFIGWYAGSYSNASTAPSGSSFYAPGATYTLTGSAVTLKAVYAKAGSGTPNTYNLVTDTSGITAGKYVLIVKGGGANGHDGHTYFALTKETVNTSYVRATNADDYMDDGDSTTSITCTDATVIWTLTGTSSSFTLTDGGSNTLNMSTNNLYYNTSTATNFTAAEYNTSDTFTINGGRYLGLRDDLTTYDSYGYARFRGNSSASNSSYRFYLFKEAGSTPPTDYETDFAVYYDIMADTNPGSKGTVAVTVGGSAASTATAGTTVNLAVSNIATGYHFVNWTGEWANEGDPLTISSNTSASGASFTMPADDVLVYANVAKNQHTLTVVSANGSVVDDNSANAIGTNTYEYGDMITLTATAATDYAFDNWTVVGTSSYTTNGNEIVIEMQDANVTVTANYHSTIVPTYNVVSTVSVTGGSPSTSGVTITPSDSTAYEQGNTVTLSITGIPTGYHFVSWAAEGDSSGDPIAITNASSATGATFSMPAEDVLLVANLAIDTHTLTITSDYGTVECDTTGDLVENDTDTFTYNYGTEELLTATADSGYVFTGWTVSGVTPEDQSGNVLDLILTADATVTANYAKVQQLSVASVANVTITATPAGGSAVAEGSSANPQVGATVTLNYSALGSAYNWTSWNVYKTGDTSTTVSVTGSGDGATFTMPAYDVTVSATVTERPTYTVQFSINGSTGDIDDATPYQGDAITLPTPSTNSDIPSSVSATYTYNTFVGWTTDEITDETSTAPTILTGSYTPTGNVTLYALYSRSASGGGNPAFVSSASSVAAGTYAIVAKRSSGNYWIMTSDLGTASTKRYQATDSEVTSDADILAYSFTNDMKWTVEAGPSSGQWYLKNVDTGTYVTWSSGNSGNLSSTPYALSADDGVVFKSVADSTRQLMLNSSTSSNYFAFYTGTQTAMQLINLGGGSTTYYVTAPVAAATYEISYNGNGADSGVPETHYIVQGQTGSVASGTPVRAGYEFAGWYDSVNDATYDPGDSITPDDDVVLVAQWTPVYTVTFNSDGGSAVASQSVVSGGTATEPTAPTKPGYAFSGWTLSGSAYNFSTAVTGNITLTATWTGYTWTIYDNGTQVASGNGPTTLPSAPSGTITYGGNTYEFYKWGVVANDISTPVTSSPGTMYDAGASFTPTANGTILRAVYTASVGGGSASTLTKMTTSDTLSDGDKIVITATNASTSVVYGLYQETTSNSYAANFEFDGNASTIAADAKKYWDVTSDGSSGFYLGDATNGYLYTSGSNNLAVSTEGNKTSWTLGTKDDSNSTTYLALLGNSRYLSLRSDLSDTYLNLWRMGGTGGASGVATLEIYKFTQGSGTTNYLTLGSVVLNDDLVLLTYATGAVTINVKANDLGLSDSDAIALDDTYTGFSVSADGKSIVFDPAAITGGFTAPVTATYTFSSYSADVTVKPAERIFYEENSGLFNFVDGKRGQWQDDSGEATTTQTLTGENGVWRTADDTAYTSLGYSGGRVMGVYVSSAVTDSSQTSTWPYVEFTFAGTGFEAIASTSNTTGSIMYEVHQGTSTSGTLVGKRTIVDTYQGASYDGSEWSATGNTVNYYQIPIIKVDNLSYGTYTVRISASYATAYDHANAGGYNFVFDGARIFNPVEGDTAAYTYRSFREAVVTAESIGVVPDSSNVAATFYVDGVAKPAIAQSVASDTSITLPTLTDSDLSSFDAKTYHFYGWLVGSDLDNDTTTAPSGANFYAGGASYTLSADTNFYAVCYYEETGSGNGGDYVKLVSGDEVTSGVYLIVCEGDEYAISKAFDGSLGVSNIDAANNYISVTVDTSGATPKIASTSTIDASTFTIDAATGTIYSAGGTYIGMSSDGNGMLHTANGEYANDISIDSSDNAVIVGSGSAHLRFNNANDQHRFRYFKSSTYSAQTAIQLYKKEGATATTYVTDLLEVVPQSLTLSGDVSNGGTLNLEVGDTASVTATLTTALRKSTNIAFSTSPSGIVTLGGSGNTRSIHAVAVGTTTVTAVCTGDNTIRASFTVNVSASSVKYGYTLNLIENSTAVTPLTATNQSTGTYTFTLPSSVDSANTPSGYTFAGWVATEYTGDNSYSGTSAGLTTSTGYIAPGGEYTMEGVASDTATATLYALYTKSESVSASSNATYQMVTSDAFTTTDTYVLAALKDSRFYFVTGTATSGSLGVESTGLASTALTGNTTFVATSLPSGAKALKVTAASGAKGIYYTVYDEDLAADVDYYLYATGSAQSLAWSSENTSETFTPNFTQNSTDGCVLTGSSGSKVSYNSSVSDFTKFIRNYTSAGSFYTDLYFFKYVEGSGSGYVTNYYFTTGTSSSSGGNGGAEGRGLTQAQVDALYTSTSQTLTVGGVSKTGFSNWGSRGEWATFLTTPAQSYYTGNYAITTLLQNSGGTSVSNFASSDLFSVLHSMLVAKHTTHGSYDAAKPILGLADCVENDTTQVSSLYDGEMIATSAFGVSGTGWNREHCWPQSKLSATNAKNDTYLLRAEGQTTNSARGNTAYGKSSGYYYPNLGSTYDVRGDVARIVMYVYTEYQESLLWGSSGVMESLDVMYEWMCADPVDTWEMGRNDVVEQFTGVRNPYVDYPELFFALFGYNIPANYRTPSAYYSSATSPASAFGGSQAPTSGVDESIPMEGNAIGIGTETRGVNRTVTVEGNTFTGAAVMVNGMGAVSNVEDFLTYGPKNELYLAQGNAIVVYVSGRASEVAVGAKALNGSATQLSVFTINGDDSLTSVLTDATEGKVSVASACERYYPITVSDIYDSGTHAERSKILLIYNPNSNPISLTNLRVNSSSGATLAVSTGSVTRAVRAVKGLHDGTAVVYGGGNDTPIIPIAPPKATLTGHSLTLEGQIGVNFVVNVPNSLITNGYYFTVNGERAELVKAEGNAMYKVTKRVAAKEMNDEVVLRFYNKSGVQQDFCYGDANTLVQSITYHVKEYLQEVINDRTGAYEAKYPGLTELCKAMSDYGVYAQTYFGYNADPNVEIYFADEIAAVTVGDEYKPSVSANTEHIRSTGCSVVTESETQINAYFVLSGDIADYTVTVDGESAELLPNGGAYYVAIPNIAAKDLGKAHTITVTYGTETLTITNFSAYSYVMAVLKANKNADLVTLAKALKYYGDCAVKYFPKEDNN